MTDIGDHFRELQLLISGLTGVEVEKYEEHLLTESRGNLRIRLRFSDDSLLETSEAIQIINNNSQRISYRYHYQSCTGNLIFRYDDAPHHPEINTYPHHKHIFDKILDSPQPDIKAVIREVNEHLMK